MTFPPNNHRSRGGPPPRIRTTSSPWSWRARWRDLNTRRISLLVCALGLLAGCRKELHGGTGGTAGANPDASGMGGQSQVGAGGSAAGAAGTAGSAAGGLGPGGTDGGLDRGGSGGSAVGGAGGMGSATGGTGSP